MKLLTAGMGRSSPFRLRSSIELQSRSDKKVSKNTDKKENKIFLIYREIQNSAFAKPYMTNDLLING
jgi:hypothetical protein